MTGKNLPSGRRRSCSPPRRAPRSGKPNTVHVRQRPRSLFRPVPRRAWCTFTTSSSSHRRSSRRRIGVESTSAPEVVIWRRGVAQLDSLTPRRWWTPSAYPAPCPPARHQVDAAPARIRDHLDDATHGIRARAGIGPGRDAKSSRRRSATIRTPRTPRGSCSAGRSARPRTRGSRPPGGAGTRRRERGAGGERARARGAAAREQREQRGPARSATRDPACRCPASIFTGARASRRRGRAGGRARRSTRAPKETRRRRRAWRRPSIALSGPGEASPACCAGKRDHVALSCRPRRSVPTDSASRASASPDLGVGLVTWLFPAATFKRAVRDETARSQRKRHERREVLSGARRGRHGDVASGDRPRGRGSAAGERARRARRERGEGNGSRQHLAASPLRVDRTNVRGAAAEASPSSDAVAESEEEDDSGPARSRRPFGVPVGAANRAVLERDAETRRADEIRADARLGGGVSLGSRRSRSSRRARAPRTRAPSSRVNESAAQAATPALAARVTRGGGGGMLRWRVAGNDETRLSLV